MVFLLLLLCLVRLVWVARDEQQTENIGPILTFKEDGHDEIFSKHHDRYA
jgi:hypothetical protein